MAAPTYNATYGTGTDAGGAWSWSPFASATANLLYVFQILQDGSTSGAVALTSVSSNMKDLAGTTGALTYLGEFPVGNPTAAYQHIWLGRTATSSGGVTLSGTNSTSEDLYWQVHEFFTVSTGTTLATVIENGTAGSTANEVGTSATAADAGVTTLGPDRLALNLVAVNDDNAIAAFTGQSGGTWVEIPEYAEASGTDGAIQIQYAAMASAGTINGGTASITDIDAWGVVGFALIGTTVTEVTYVPRNPGIHFNDPAIV